VVTVWHRSKAKINLLLGGAPQETHIAYDPTRPLPFPYEIVEMIIAHLIHDLDSLKACSLTCSSWYTASVPHLHHTLTLTGNAPSIGHDQLVPLPNLHELGLVHLVKVVQVKQDPDMICWFTPQAFSHPGLRYFSALTNVRTLELQEMEICRFIPGIEDYFGHFSQTLRSITLFSPSCTPRQLSYFLSLFSNLENIEIWDPHLLRPTSPREPVPFSAPEFRGRLVLYNLGIRWVETWTHLLTSGGSLRFRHMDLRGSASCAPVLFEACAETLETIQFGLRSRSASK